MDIGAFVNCLSNLAFIEHLLCARPCDKPDTDSAPRNPQSGEEDTCGSVIIAQCVYVKCLLEGKAKFDAGTNQAASRKSHTEAEAELKAEGGEWVAVCGSRDGIPGRGNRKEFGQRYGGVK